MCLWGNSFVPVGGSHFPSLSFCSDFFFSLVLPCGARNSGSCPRRKGRHRWPWLRPSRVRRDRWIFSSFWSAVTRKLRPIFSCPREDDVENLGKKKRRKIRRQRVSSSFRSDLSFNFFFASNGTFGGRHLWFTCVRVNRFNCQTRCTRLFEND